MNTQTRESPYDTDSVIFSPYWRMENVSARGPFGRHHKQRTSAVNHKGERKIIIKKQSARTQGSLQRIIVIECKWCKSVYLKEILLINKVTSRLAILTISKLTCEKRGEDVFAGYFKARILDTYLAKLRTRDFFDGFSLRVNPSVISHSFIELDRVILNF